MGSDINYPDQPTYGEGLKEALLAQLGIATGQQIGDDTTFSQLAQQLKDAGLLQDDQLLGEAIANIDTRIREQYGKSEVDLLEKRLLGDITRAGEGGRYVSGQQFTDASGNVITNVQQVTSEADRDALWLQERPDIQQAFDNPSKVRLGSGEREKIAQIKAQGGTALDFAAYHRQRAISGRYGADQQAKANAVPKVGDYYNPESLSFDDGKADVLTQEDVYSIHEGGEGAIIDRTGGLLDLYGGDTKVRQYDVESGETKYGTAGFDEDTGEFQGLVPMQAQAQGYLSTLQREGDIADVELLGSRATEAIRDQGNIRSALEQVKDIQGQGRESVGDLRTRLLGQANELLGSGLTDREIRNIQEFSRSAGVASGRTRDIGRVSSEVGTLLTQDRARQLQNISAAQTLLGSEMGMQGQEMGQALQLLGAEQATAADPMMAIIGRPSSSAPGAQNLLSTGAAMQQAAGPQNINPEAGLGYISNRAANQATVAAGQAAGQGNLMSGVISGIANVAAAPATGGGSLASNLLL